MSYMVRIVIPRLVRIDYSAASALYLTHTLGEALMGLRVRRKESVTPKAGDPANLIRIMLA